MVPGLAAATKTPFHRYSVVPKNETTVSNSTGPTLGEGVEVLSGVAALAATTKRYFKEVTSPGMLQASVNPSMAGVTFSEFAATNKFGALLTQK